MPRSLSSAMRAAANAPETGEAVIYLLRLEHASIGNPILVCNNGVDQAVGAEVYQAFPFDIELPEESGESSPRVSLRICNVDRRIVEAVRVLTGEMQVTLIVVLQSSPATIEAGPHVFTLKRVEYDALVVEGDLAYEDLVNEPYPGDQFNQANFPGLA